MDEIYNCVDRLGQPFDGCASAVFTDYDIIDVEFANLQKNCKYKIFYVITNHYPLRPVNDPQNKVLSLLADTIEDSLHAVVLYAGYLAICLILLALVVGLD